MAQFIHPENQRILWDALHKSPHIDKLDPSIRSNWFKMKIQETYDQMGGPNFFHKHISVHELNQINQMTLRNMIHSLGAAKPPLHPQIGRAHV